MNDWKKRLGVVFSTNPDFDYTNESDDETVETLEPKNQRLRVAVEKKGRGGKTVTVVKGFQGSDDDLGKLEKMLKTKCGTGGTSKDSLILLQGDIKEKVINILRDLGYTDTK